MSIDWNETINNMITPTNAQMVVLLTNAIAQVSIGKLIEINGRRIERSELPDLINALAIYKRLAAQDAGRSNRIFPRIAPKY